ncbi:MAG: NAD(+) synthase, partial [Defluviitaleaceae bacterium]|nr:NAD(+) synthase [Defluviitaleaceae bacterium]
ISHTGAERAVINVSGGLDSALALLVTAGAMDLLERARADILALFLPGFGTTRRTTANARLLIQALGADTREIDIKPACLQHFKDIGLDPNNPNVVYENAQARERTQIALDIANMEGGLMVGTGNMSELALGFTTFGGDLLSAYNPNCGLTKTAVREVVKWAAHSELFGTDAAKALLDILNTPISPELLPPSDGKITQITEETVGPYELIDFFLYHMIKNGFAPDKISFLANTAFNGKYTLETINHWLKSFIKRFFANQFKRISAPEGPAVLGISLSPRGGFSMPGDANANCWLEQ